MERALQLAAHGLGRTSPNPAVGAVVARDGEVIAEAYHRRAGELHAERLALLTAGERAQGADLYCTLEPCCHYGRTPPCTEIIIQNGIRRVWYASSDPDPRCAGQGAAALRAAGVEVHAGLLATEADRLNEAYFHHKRTGLPFVTLKLACSLDGRAATRTGQSRWITGPAAREYVHELRDRSDAVLVGVGTVLADDPKLNVRLEREGTRDPLRVVADSQARTPPSARVLSPGAACLVAVTEAAPETRVGALRAAGAEVLRVAEAEGRVDLAALLAKLGGRDVMSVLCEGGPTLAAGLVGAGRVGKYLLFYAPMLLGGDGLPAVGALGFGEVAQAPVLSIESVRTFGPDIMVTAYPCSQD
jgi:diaminohydroxyphosphoribosylaminopyrimidine deaminase/5-amino-6-(5-phosphoribosylamino)uracil reductase